ncbi:archaemetzincin [Mariniphaga anaerophila]|uniref:Archaemetzincin n=1 Tax=Mariniphaga anaerophila TaxID=1484053 RepID=A0A1M4WHI3_9BACT|nr:archaemetzincin family Zn-dependent metalloprotease [Mariniphaga anaerophila]SHE80610.1 archaemetzincin [Mariniphaga anaerophila]
MDKQQILLISFGQFEQDLLQQIAAEVQAVFGIPVEVESGYADLSKFYDPARRQYDGNLLIQFIHSEYGADHRKTIGLFRVDLFIPILTYIIGQAIYKGNAGVVSVFRLKSELYGLKKDDDLLFDRFVKEIIHELGHTFGLTHCISPACVMRPSTYIEDVDQKEAAFCAKCRKKLGETR